VAPAVDYGRSLRLIVTVVAGTGLACVARLTDPSGWLAGACIAAAAFVALAQQTIP
jgi:hypothetical protein